MRAVDTNVLVRLLTRDDPGQLAAAEDFIAPGAWVSHVVLVEASWVLSSVYEVPPSALATSLEMLLDHQSLVVQDPETVAAAVARFQEKPALGFSDSLILELARKAGHLPLGTFDRELGKVAGTVGLVG
ncbi:MAG TPA: type II toxin-antitoxin system VapC family toxin [Thermoanaerobaculia bacterium]|nr:type II toxin-antitoxin system VapC family toxin [Thermoanaerobaculia bacterium]